MGDKDEKAFNAAKRKQIHSGGDSDPLTGITCSEANGTYSCKSCLSAFIAKRSKKSILEQVHKLSVCPDVTVDQLLKEVAQGKKLRFRDTKDKHWKSLLFRNRNAVSISSEDQKYPDDCFKKADDNDSVACQRETRRANRVRCQVPFGSQLREELII